MTSEGFYSETNIDFVDELKRFRYEWSDDIPQSLVHSTDKENRYKVRNAWFDHVLYTVYFLEEGGRINNEGAKKAAQELNDKFSSEEFKNRGYTSAEDIQTANKLIDVILESI